MFLADALIASLGRGRGFLIIGMRAAAKPDDNLNQANARS
jgi:hypothetical protein